MAGLFCILRPVIPWFPPLFVCVVKNFAYSFLTIRSGGSSTCLPDAPAIWGDDKDDPFGIDPKNCG